MPGFTPQEFRELFDGNRDVVFRFLWHLTRNGADAEDLLQETFLTVWRKRDQFEGRGSAAGWLRRTAFRTYLNHLEKKRRRSALVAEHRNGRKPTEPESPPTDRIVGDAEATGFLVARAHEAIAELPDGQREAFVLFRLEGLTCAEIADASGESVKTVETRVRRATLALAERLRKYRRHLPAS